MDSFPHTPHLLLVGARSEVIGKLVGLPLAVSVIQKPGRDSEFERSVALRTASVDFTDPDALLATAREIHDWRRVDAVLSLTEPALYPASVVGEALGVRVNPVATVGMALDKSTMRRRLADRGLDTTAFRVCTSLDEARELVADCPAGVVLKPVNGNAGTGVSLVRDPADLAAAWEWTTSKAKGSAVLAEEYLLGREISVETLSAAGEHRVLAVTGKYTYGPPHFAETGHDLPAPLPPEEHAAACSVVLGALDAIGQTWGPCHTEVIIRAGRAIIVEINTRVGGDRIWEMVEIATGVNLAAAAAAALAYGELPSADAVPRGAAAVRFLTPPPGRIASISGVEEALAVDGVIRVGDLFKIGDVVGRLTDSWDRAGYVLAAGSDVEAAAGAAEEAAGLVTIMTE